MGRRVNSIRLFCVDNLSWVITRIVVNQAITILERYAAKSIMWDSQHGLQFDTGKIEGAQFTP